MADTELKIKVSAQLSDTKAALESLTKQLAAIAQGGTQLGAAATAGFARMEASAERAAAAARDVADASTRISTALEAAQAKAAKPPPIPKAPKAALTEGVADQNAIQKAALKQQLADLEASHKAGLTSEKAYYQQRAQIQRAALSAEIAQAKAMQAAATSQQQKNQAATRIATLTQQRSAVSEAIPSLKPTVNEGLNLQAILGKVGAAAAALGVTISAIGAATGFVSLAGQAAMLEGRLKLATKSTAEYNIANAQLYAMSQRTRSEFGQMVGLYARLSISTKTLGTSQAELLRATETISKALKLSFSGSVEGANAALMQLGQGLASGTLRGDELVSVLEQAPRLAEAIAVGMGKTTADLKKMGEAGQITAQNVLAALKSQAAGIDAEFKLLPRQIDGSMTMLKNALVKGAGEIDKVTGVTNTLAGALEKLIPVIERVSAKLTEHFARMGATGGDNLRSLTKDAGSLTAIINEQSSLQKAFGSLGTAAEKAWELILRGMQKVSDYNLKRNATEEILQAAQTKRAQLRASYEAEALRLATSGGSQASRDAAAAAAWNTYLQQLKTVELETKRGIDAIEKNLKRLGKSGDDAAAKVRAQAAEQKRLSEQKVPEPMGPPRPPKPLEGKVDYREIQKKALAVQLEDLKAAYAAEYITTEQYYKKRLELQQRMADLEIAQARIAVGKATTSDAKSTAMTNLAQAQKDKQKLAEDYKRDIFIATESGVAKQATLEAEKNRQQLEDLQRMYDQGLESTADYYRHRLMLQEWALNQEIAAEKVVFDYATTLEERDASKTRQEMLELKRAELHKQRSQDQVDDEKKTATAITQIRTQALASEHKLVEARKAELEAQYADLIKRFTLEGDEDSVNWIKKLIDTELAKARLAELQAEIDKVMARFHAAEQSAANAVALGTSKKGAANETREAAQVALVDLKKPRDEMAQMAETSVEAKVALQGVDASVTELNTKSLSGIAKAVSDMRRELDGLKASFSSDMAFALRDSITTLFTDIVTGSKRGTEALRDFARNFAKSIAQIIAQILATRVAMALIKGGSGIFGGLFGTGGGGATAAVHHAGGIVGAPGAPSRSVPLATFYGAPKLHQGGALGLGSDEVPAILQRGEEVLSKSDPRNVRNAGAAGRGQTTMVVQLHPDHNHRTMRDWLEGELARVAATT